MLKKVAITGNIASGKSQVEKFLAENYPVYDTDKIAHEILGEIKFFYGYDVFTDGKIDRQKLGKLVFENPDLKKKLEDIVHPKVRKRIVDIFTKHKNDRVVFVSVPLLFEAGFEDMFNKIIFIKVNEIMQLNRLMERNGFTKDEALLRSQLESTNKDNVAKLQAQIDSLKNELNNSKLEKDIAVKEAVSLREKDILKLENELNLLK